MTDLLDLLKHTKQQDGLTTGEIAEQLGFGDSEHAATKVRKMLKAQIRAGKVEVAQGQRAYVNGTMGNAWVYRRVDSKAA